MDINSLFCKAEQTVTFRMKGESWGIGGEEKVNMALEEFKALLSLNILLNSFQSSPEDTTKRDERSLHAYPQASSNRFDNTWASQQTRRISEIDQHWHKLRATFGAKSNEGRAGWEMKCA